MKDLARVCDEQNEIIKKQSDIIDELFLQVIQYVEIEDEESVLSKIEDVEAQLWKH